MPEFYFRTTENESIRASIHIQPETRCIIEGTVMDENQQPITQAAVLLYLGMEPHTMLAHSFTGDDGSFCFGPLESDTLYKIRVYKNNTKIRELEIKTEV